MADETNLNSLMSKGGLVRKISEEFSNSIKTYTELLGVKIKTCKDLEKNPDDERLRARLLEVLVSERDFWKRYSSGMDTIDRVKKILADMSSSKGRLISKDQLKQVNNFVKMLDDLKYILKHHFLNSSVSELVDKQVLYLSNRNFKKLFSYIRQENRLLSIHLGKIVSSSPSMSELLNRKRTVFYRRLNISLCTFSLAINTLNIILHIYASSLNSDKVKDSTQYIYEYQAVGSTEYKNLELGLKQAIQMDTLESGVERSFQDKTGINILGDFYVEDIDSIQGILVKYYSLGFMKKLGIGNIFFVQGKIKKCIRSKGNHEDFMNDIIGIAYDTTMVLNLPVPDSSSEWNYSVLKVFMHELGHYIDRYLDSKSNFHSEWGKIPKAYVSEYAKTNICEDIAETFEWISSFTSYDVVTEESIDDALKEQFGDDGKIIKQKLVLLKKYGFFDQRILFSH